MTGKADKTHTHAASSITSGEFDVNRLPTIVYLANKTSSAISVNGHNNGSCTINVSESGLDCVGIVGFNSNHNQSISFYKVWRDSISQASCLFYNGSSSNWTDIKITLCCLYVPNHLY